PLRSATTPGRRRQVEGLPASPPRPARLADPDGESVHPEPIATALPGRTARAGPAANDLLDDDTIAERDSPAAQRRASGALDSADDLVPGDHGHDAADATQTSAPLLDVGTADPGDLDTEDPVVVSHIRD